MVNFIVDISRVSPLLAAFVNLIMGALVFSKNTKSNKNRLFVTFSLALAGWTFACFIQSIVVNTQIALFWDKLLYTAAIAAPLLLYLTICAFSGVKPSKLIYFGYVVSSGLIYINWTEYFRIGVTYNLGERFVTIPSWGWFTYLLFFLVVIFGVFYRLILGLKLAKCQKERYQYKILLGSIGLLILGGGSYFLLIISSFNAIIDSLLNLNSSLFAVIYSLTMSYLIIKHEVMDISIIIKKLTAQILTFLVVASSIVFVFYLFYHSMPLLILSCISLGVFWAFFAIPLRTYLITTAKRKFVKGWYDDTLLISELGKELALVFDANSAFDIIQGIFDKHLQLSEISIGSNKQNLVSIELNKNSMAVAVPLTVESRFDVVLLCGKRDSGSRYTADDLLVLTAVQYQINIALERIKYFNELQEINKNLEVLVKEKVAEAETAKAYAQKVAQQASFGTLTKGIAHELRNPLGMMLIVHFAVISLNKVLFNRIIKPAHCNSQAHKYTHAVLAVV